MTVTVQAVTSVTLMTDAGGLVGTKTSRDFPMEGWREGLY